MVEWVKALRRAAAAAVITAGALWLAPLSAEAHANLVSAQPAADSSSPVAPTQVQLWFSERPEPRLSTIQILNEHGQRVDTGNPNAPIDNPQTLVEAVQPGLPNGTYTVSWQTTSAVDGHVTGGSFGFGVGPAADTAQIAAPTSAKQATVSWSAALTRWLNDVAFVLLFGVIFFEPVVLRRAFVWQRDTGSRTGEWIEAVALRGRRLSRSLAALGVLASCAAVVDQVWRSTQVASIADVEITLTTPLGLLLLARCFVAVVLLCAAAGVEPNWTHRSLGAAAAIAMQRHALVVVGRGGLLPAAASVQLLLLTLTSHALAVTSFPALFVMVDWLHLALGSVWVGGLAMLALAVLPTNVRSTVESTLGGPDGAVHSVVSRFARVALIAAGGLGLSGLIMASVQLESLSNLLSTGYGWALVAKTAIFIAALALAAEHRFVLLPLLKSPELAAAASGRRWFSRSLPAEAFLGIGILAAASLLANLPPPGGRAAGTQTVSRDVSGIHVAVQVQPLVAGPNELQVTLTRNGQPVTDAEKVELQLQPANTGTGPAVVDLSSAGPGVYATLSDALSIAGAWGAQLLIRTPGEFDRRTDFALAVRAGANGLAAVPDDTGQAVAVTSAVPQAGDLSLAGVAADTLVGLTLRPGQPGNNRLLVYILPKDGQKAAGAASVALSIDGRTVPLRQCAPTCRLGDAQLAGGEQVRVQVGEDPDAAAEFQVPVLPAVDGTQLLGRVQARMGQLKSVRIDEMVGPGNPGLKTSYLEQAPDRLSAQTASGEQLMSIGLMRFNRPSPDQPWVTDAATEALKMPSFMWDALPAQSVYLTGRDVVDGTGTQALSFVELDGLTPSWFRLSVRPDGLVLQAQMQAAQHFMADRYSGFDEPLDIQPPDAAPS